MKLSLYQQLLEYSHSQAYPLHMPGHKRQWGVMENPYSFDITEIYGFDDLHYPDGILQESQQMAAEVYGVKASYYLINGSTSGIMTAISAAVKPGEAFLAARNCHRSVWNTAFLRNLNTVLLDTQSVLSKDGKQNYPFSGAVTADSVKEAIEKNPCIKAVMITSPTYEGVVSPIEEIADAAHRYGIPLIVDEAHGAHLPFSKDNGFFPASAIREGADVVIQSLHKTLPSLTQTAILHINSELIDEREIKRFYSIYQTSSPSYVLMASIDNCIQYMDAEGRTNFLQYESRLRQFWKKTEQWNNLWFLFRDRPSHVMSDPSKIVFGSRFGSSGIQLMQRLREEFQLECEMCQEDYVIAMTSLMDTEDGFIRLEQAMARLNDSEKKTDSKGMETDFSNRLSEMSCRQQLPQQRQLLKKSKKLEETEKQEKTVWVLLSDSEGEYSAGNIAIYPPGIPFLTTGQCITRDMIQQIETYIKEGFRLDGISQTKEHDNTFYEIEIFDKNETNT